MFPLSKFKLAGSVSWCCVAFQIIMNELIWKFLVLVFGLKIACMSTSDKPKLETFVCVSVFHFSF